MIVGLGNPGIEYRTSRHNIGFIILDNYAFKKKISYKTDKNSQLAKRNSFILLKPLTFMNLSGQSIIRFCEIPTETLVVCDDIYLPFGEVRIRNAGGDGGHNGLKSVIKSLNDDRFIRMRIGVGYPDESEKLQDFVLDNFSEKELLILDKTINFALMLIDCFIANGYQYMLNHYSKYKKTYSESIISESMSTGGK